MKSLIRSENGAIKGLLIAAVAIVLLTIYTQYSADRTAEINAINGNVYTSPLNEFQVYFPSDWEIGKNSYEDTEQGIYTIVLDGPRNAAIAEHIQAKYDYDVTDNNLADSMFIDVMNRAVAADYATVLIDAISASDYDLSESREEWKEQLLAEANVATGISFSNFETIEVEGGLGYSYDTTISEGDGTMVTANYFLLGAAVELDITILPTSSTYIDTAETIVNEIIISIPEITTASGES